MDSFFGELIKLGAAGLVIWVIAAPLIRYLIDRSKEQDTYVQRLINDHLQHDQERHQKLIAGLEKIEKSIERQPDITLARIAGTYPPQDYQKTATAAERILTTTPQTVVNVAQPGPVNAPANKEPLTATPR